MTTKKKSKRRVKKKRSAKSATRTRTTKKTRTATAQSAGKTKRKRRRLLNGRKEARERGSFPTVLSHKSAMMLLHDYLNMYSTVPMPKFNLSFRNLEQSTAAFLISIHEGIAQWDKRTLAMFFKEVVGTTKQLADHHSWEAHINFVKRVIYDIFYMDKDDCSPVMEAGVYKMWPGGYTNKGVKEMGFGKRANKGAQKVSSKKKTTKKKAAKKKVAKKATRKVAAAPKQGKVNKKAAKKATRKVAKKTAKKVAKKTTKKRKSKGVNTEGQLCALNKMDLSLVPDNMKLVRNPDKKLRAGTVGDLVGSVPNGKRGVTVGALIKKGFPRTVIFRAVQRFYLIVK